MLRRYCVLYEERLRPKDKVCDVTFRITSEELESESPLSDVVLEMTSDLYSHNIWSQENYIIFMLPKHSERNESIDAIHPEDLAFLFRFFWRFFKGLRTIICFEGSCYKHDPDTKEVQLYNIDDRNLLTFDLRRFRGQVTLYTRFHEYIDAYDLASISISITMMGLELLMMDHNWAYDFELRHIIDDGKDDRLKNAHKLNTALLISETSVALREADFTKFDFSGAIDSCYHCIATPRNNFIPSFLVPIKVFSPPVWAAIGLASLLFFAGLFLFQSSQCNLFRGLYSDVELFAFGDTSVFFTVVSYFIVGRPSRLLLGRFCTGKILFTIISFSVLIIVAVFQSNVTTLLSRSVHYADIHTLKDLSESELSIQTTNRENALEILEGHENFDALKGKLTESSHFYQAIIREYLEEDDRKLRAYSEGFTDEQRQLNETDVMTTVEMNIQSIMTSDAIEVASPMLHRGTQGNFWLTHLFIRRTEAYHLVEECISTYPLTLRIAKGSLFADAFIERVNRLIEVGVREHLTKDFKFTASLSNFNRTVERYPKPFGMENLQPAFTSLAFGWTLSCIAFICELSIDILRETKVFRLLKSAQTFFCFHGLWRKVTSM
ncbi:unnamed protein product [Bemisia tabaci]|uniref:Ionotropic receptor n=1 Tax=Bemisia tabaci TaxID=7038 RepID=A0A9P0ABA9_BEMTA|nr:unnamed protein product [Bemisia tabaci]